MIAISTTEFRTHLRKYLDLAKVQRVIIQCGKDETFELVPSERMSDGDRYMAIPENAAALREAIEDVKAGRVTRIKDPKNIWDSIL